MSDHRELDDTCDDARTERLPSADELAARAPVAKLVRWWPIVRKYGVPVASGVLGCLSAVAVYALGFAEDRVDAKATAREREAERVWLVKSVRDDLIPDVAGLKAEVRSLRETLRLYFPAGALRLQDAAPLSLPAGEP